jgi:hypothetical protein
LDNFFIWFYTGLTHIASLNGYDHILFLLALYVIYTVDQWKSLLILVTAFTLGHSLTLALSVFDILIVKTEVTEFLIPLTIIFTSIFNIKNRKGLKQGHFRGNYLAGFFFGLIHGLGFSTILKSLLGHSENILSPLFAFNLGLEAGQLIILGSIIVFSVALTGIFSIRREKMNMVVSIVVLILSIIIAGSRLAKMIA